MKALRVHAGPRARCILAERGLQAQDVRVVPGAAGGPKGLVLNPLDRFIFGHWMAGTSHAVHLIGASIGAWRLACACLPDADAALAQLAEDYIAQDYPHEPGKLPTADQVSDAFGRKIDERLTPRADEILGHPHRRLHVVTGHGRRLLRRESRWRTPLGYACAFAANTLRRRWLGAWIERVVFSDPRDVLPIVLTDFPGCQVALTRTNLASSILASCSIPFWLRAVHDIPQAPPGAYWDGGLTDYHLHLPYASMADGLVLYPHFQATVVPGWLDKPWRGRHRATSALDNLVLLCPSPEWVATLPGGKLPDRSDFKTYADDLQARQRAWRVALSESVRLAEEFADLTRRGSVEPLPLP